MADIGLMIKRRAGEGSRGDVEIMDKRHKLEGRVGASHQLLPGLPNDITLDHVAPKLPWTAFHMLLTVSHGWQQAIRSRKVYDSRVRFQSTQTLVVMNHGDGHAISLYSLRDRSCYRLPPIPGFEKGLPLACQCITWNGKLYVLGGFEGTSADLDHLWGRPRVSSVGLTNTIDQASAKVYMWDLVEQREWRQCASMADPRAKFGCGVANGKIYVFGGTSSFAKVVYCGSEVYDPKSDAWSPIASMESLGEFQQVVSMGNEIIVNNEVYNIEGVHHLSGGGFMAEIYKALKDQWICLQVDSSQIVDHSIRGMIKDSIGTFEKAFMVRGKLHTLSGVAHSMDVYDVQRHSWEFTRTSSFGIFQPSNLTSNLQVLLAVAVVDDGLLGVAQWTNLNTDQKGTHLVRCHGLNSQCKEIDWQKIECPLSFDEVDSPFLCPIEL